MYMDLLATVSKRYTNIEIVENDCNRISLKLPQRWQYVLFDDKSNAKKESFCYFSKPCFSPQTHVVASPDGEKQDPLLGKKL